MPYGGIYGQFFFGICTMYNKTNTERQIGLFLPQHVGKIHSFILSFIQRNLFDTDLQEFHSL